MMHAEGESPRYRPPLTPSQTLEGFSNNQPKPKLDSNPPPLPPKPLPTQIQPTRNQVIATESTDGFHEVDLLQDDHKIKEEYFDNNAILENVQLSIIESPKKSVMEGISMTIKENFRGEGIQIGKALFGLSGKELKSNFKNALEKDEGLKKPLRIFKGIGRVLGLVLGIGLNLISRVVAFAVSASFSVLAMGVSLLGLLFKQGESELWKNPSQAMAGIFSIGMVAGAAAGALVGTIGNVLVQKSLSMQFNIEKGLLKGAWNRSFDNNAAASIGGAAVGSAISLVNPLLWRAAFTK